MHRLIPILFYFPIAISLFWIITLSIDSIIKREKYKVPYILFLVNLSLALGVGILFRTKEFDLYYSVYFFTDLWSFSIYPLFYIFIKNLTSERNLNRFDFIRHLSIPFLMFLIGILVSSLHGFPSASHLQEVLSGEYTGDKLCPLQILDISFRVLYVFISLFYILLTEVRVNQHKAKIPNYFSDTEGIDIKWYGAFRVIFILTWFSSLVFYVLNQCEIILNSILPWLSYFCFAVFFGLTSYFVSKQKEIYFTNDEESEGEQDVLHIDREISALKIDLDALMIEKEIFLNSKLTLPDLAKELGTNRTYLSQFFNEYLETNFKQYINRFRIDYAKELIKLDEFPISQIYRFCGFNSSSSFYNVFSQIVQMTPTQYRDKIT